jgi:LacI family transcriptional regulator
MTVSLKKIAQEMNISISSVSRALAGKPGVSEAQRILIENKAKKLGYKPDPVARTLRTGEGYGVTIIAHLDGSETTLRRNYILFEKCKEVFENITIVIVSDASECDNEIWNAITRKTKAIILALKSGNISCEIKKLLIDRKIPLISIDCNYDSFDSVGIDRATGTYQAARMLLISGCKAPVFYSTHTLEYPDDRLKGIIRAFESLGKSPQEIQISFLKSPIRNHSEQGVVQAAQLINSQAVDGIFCYNDNLAIGTMRVLAKAGLRVPDDVRIIGFDDISIAANLPISITSVAMPLHELVDGAIELTKGKIENFKSETQNIIFPTNLIVRESSPITDNSIRNQIFEKLKGKKDV